MIKLVDPLTSWPVGQESSGVGVAKRAALAISGRDASATRPSRSLPSPPINDRFALLKAAEHSPEDLVVLFADSDRLNNIGAEVIEEFARDDNLANEAHAEAPGFGLNDNDAFAFDQFTIAFERAATFSLFAEHDDTVDVALVLTRGAIPFDGRELLDQQAVALVERAPVPARHGGLVFAHAAVAGKKCLAIS